MIDTSIMRNWTNQKQILPISLESFEINSSLLQAPKTLREFVSQYKENRKMMNIQKGENQDKNSNLKMFISSFITDALVFPASLLTVVITFIIIYILSGQSKLNTLVANIALQCVKAIEALNPKNQGTQKCEFGVVKFLKILNLVIVALMALAKLKKSRIFQGHFFSNMVKFKLFIADTTSYVPLELNKLARNVHLFKFTGTLLLDNVTLRKNCIWDVLEVNWDNVCVTLNEREINLPMSLVIPIEYKMKIRELFKKKDSLHLYIMLKQRKSWLNLENTDCDLINKQPPLFS